VKGWLRLWIVSAVVLSAGGGAVSLTSRDIYTSVPFKAGDVEAGKMVLQRLRDEREAECVPMTSRWDVVKA
jgi:hypothetical protein